MVKQAFNTFMQLFSEQPGFKSNYMLKEDCKIGHLRCLQNICTIIIKVREITLDLVACRFL